MSAMPTWPSQQMLADDLRAAGAHELAERALTNEWSDYDGPHTFPQMHLIQTLRDFPLMANVNRKQLIANIKAGKYDSTKEEAEGWAQSEEGQATFRELLEGQ
jgi:hypothetical protein